MFLVSHLKIHPHNFLIAATLSSLVVSIISILQWILINLTSVPVDTYAGRVVSTFGQPNFYSGFLVITLPLIWHLFHNHHKYHLGYFTIVLINLVAIFLSESKTAIILVGLLSLIFIYHHLKANFKKLFILFWVLVVIAGVLASFKLQSGPLWSQLDSPTESHWLFKDTNRGFILWKDDWSKNPEKRIYIWPVIVDLSLQKPLFGFGIASLPENFSKSRLAEYHGLKNLNVDSAHNIILDLLYSSGFIGLSLWLAIVVMTLKKLKISYYLLSFIILLIWSQTHNQSVVLLIIFWLLVGISSQLKNFQKEL